MLKFIDLFVGINGFRLALNPAEIDRHDCKYDKIYKLTKLVFPIIFKNIIGDYMLNKLRELSVKLWEPIGNVFYYLFDSSGIWLPIIVFFLGTFTILFLIRKILDIFVELPLIKIFQVMFKFLIKAIIFSLVISIFVSLGFYIQSLYAENVKKVVKKQQSVDYLLR